jgi:tRNA nucleotidyltransferase (CCA-adding enzyme)
MKSYLVGGAVRDQLLNYPVRERDWVVIGETTESMIAQGFRPVGKDFPVFLHPQTQDEYALARTERKTAPGYKGFIVHASPDVTLEQDLVRRDLTINAMAMDRDGVLIDPYGGQKDLEARILRHVSPAFTEDPVRILRVARFAARYRHLGFDLATETRELMSEMVRSGETEFLVAERVWAELHKALLEQSPSAFFYLLRDCGALASIFPEIEQLFGVPQPRQYHPEIDTGIHCMMVLEQAALLTGKAEVRLAALLHDLGKGMTDPDKWPGHHGHEQNGLPLLEQFCQRLRIPKQFKVLSQQVMQYHTHCHRIGELKASTIVDFLQAVGVFKKGQQNFADFLLACEADMKGRTGFEMRPYPQADFAASLAQAAVSADITVAMNGGLRGAQIGEAIRRIRIAAVTAYIRNNPFKSE